MKYIRKFFLYFLLLNVVLFLGLFIRNKFYLGEPDDQFVNYLNLHKQNIDLSKAEFSLFDEQFYQSNIFLLTENHGFEDIQKIDDQLFIHLNKKNGTRFYIAEMDSLRAKMLNQYLSGKTPNEPLLLSVVKDIKIRIPQQSSTQLLEKWQRIYAYNQTLPLEKQIEVLGIDQDFDLENATLSRDSSMLLNLKSIVEKRGLQNEKFYGLFGFYHGLQTGVNEQNRYPFAAKLKRSHLDFVKNVQTIASFFIESEMYMPKIEGYPSPPDGKISWFNVDGPIVLVKGINDLKATSQPNTTTLYQLNAEGSPYHSTQRLAGVKTTLLGDNILPNNDKQVTTAFYQYVILFRGSKALTPLD